MNTLLESRPAADTDVASQWQLMWLPFRKHRLAMAGSVVVGSGNNAVSQRFVKTR